jgi:replicative DNA helicase
MSSLTSLKLEQHLNSGLLKYPHKIHEIQQFFSSEDFSDSVGINATVFKLIQSMVAAGEPVDHVLIAQKAANLNIKFESGVNVFDYLQSLSIRPVADSSIAQSAKELKKLSIRRRISSNALKIKEAMGSLDSDSSFDEIISTADKIYHSEISEYFSCDTVPKNLFEDMEANIEFRGENPITDFGLMGPLPRTNELYGSLLRAGNITVIASRYGVGKSTLALDYCSRTGSEHNVPTLHFDNGEMSYDEIQNRMCAAISGVPLYFIETGNWRKNPKTTEQVRAAFKKIKGWKFYYYNVGGLGYEEMINLARNWYYLKVGRGNKMILSFDYIKAFSVGSDEQVWLGIGKMLEAFKTFIQKEIIFEREPQISLFSSVQANRLGISNRPNNVEVDDTEASIGLSDMIGQIASHLFILRKKTTEEVINEGQHFGTHKMIHVKSRHLGKNPTRALDFVDMPDGSKKKNYIHLDIKNFRVEEKGDLVDWCNQLIIQNSRPVQDGGSDLPI